MAVPRPPPAFLLAGQAADPWLPTHCSPQVHDVTSTKQLAAGEDSEAASDFSSAPPPSAGSRPAIYAVTARPDDSVDENIAAGGLRSIAADTDKAATERGGPVYLEQPDGSVQLKLLRNPLYRPPVDSEDAAAAERDVPLYRAVLDGTYQARVYDDICPLAAAHVLCLADAAYCHVCSASCSLTAVGFARCQGWLHSKTVLLVTGSTLLVKAVTVSLVRRQHMVWCAQAPADPHDEQVRAAIAAADVALQRVYAQPPSAVLAADRSADDAFR